MDYESERTRPINEWTTNEATHNFEPSLDYCNFLIDIDFGKNCPDETRQFWQKTIQANYQGEDGRRWARMAAINLRERDGLHGRLPDVKCPVMWLHGTDDVVYSVANAEEEIRERALPQCLASKRGR